MERWKSNRRAIIVGMTCIGLQRMASDSRHAANCPNVEELQKQQRM